jgi:anti-sigma28 factor (negative regulator of flagellin synthesis)
MKIDSYKITQSSEIQKKKEMQSDSKANKNKSDSAKTTPANLNKIGDVLEMSSDVRKLKEIKTKIESGYYDSPAVLREAAQRLLQSL